MANMRDYLEKQLAVFEAATKINESDRAKMAEITAMKTILRMSEKEILDYFWEEFIKSKNNNA